MPFVWPNRFLVLWSLYVDQVPYSLLETVEGLLALTLLHSLPQGISVTAAEGHQQVIKSPGPLPGNPPRTLCPTPYWKPSKDCLAPYWKPSRHAGFSKAPPFVAQLKFTLIHRIIVTDPGQTPSERGLASFSSYGSL